MQISTKSALAIGAIGLPVGLAIGALWGRAPAEIAPPPKPAISIAATATPPTAGDAPLPVVIEPIADDGIQVLPPNADALLPQATATSKPAPTPKPAPTKPPPSVSAPDKNLVAGAPVVCIDPGHPSETSDGANSHGLSENRLNWQVALDLKPLLEARGIRCVLTKNSENQRVTNRQRADIANKANARVFVRLHCDEGAGRGYTWYYPDRSGKKFGVSGPPATVQRDSRAAAQIINAAMKPVLKGYLQSNPIKTDASTFVGGKQGGVLTGSIFARVPTALIEMCYINQKGDAQFIASKSGRQRMAQALAIGIEAWVRR